MKAQAYDNSQTLFKAFAEGEIDMAAGVQKSNVYSDIKYSTITWNMNVLVKAIPREYKNALQERWHRSGGGLFDYQTNAKEI